MARRRQRLAIGTALLVTVGLGGALYRGVLGIRESADRMKDT